MGEGWGEGDFKLIERRVVEGRLTLSAVNDLLRSGRSLLHNKVAAPAIEAKALLLEATGLSEVEFLASPNRIIAAKDERRFRRLIRKRLSGMPLAYILGRKEFWSMTFRVGPGVIIPRPETELLVEKTLESAGGRPTIIDIGTGSGNIALALAKDLPAARIVATDVSSRALRYARINAQNHGIENVTFVRGSLFSALQGLGLEGRCDFVVSNPPYVSSFDWDSISPEVKNHEPRRAFHGGKTGLGFIARLIKGAPPYLQPGGYLLFEVGFGQANAARALLETGWRNVQSFADLRGIPRVIMAKRV